MSKKELSSTQEFSTARGENRPAELSQTQSTQHMTSRQVINSDQWFTEHWELLVDFLVHFLTQGRGSKAKFAFKCLFSV